MSWADEYLREVEGQIRIKRIRSALTGELRDHMELQKADYLDAGMTESEAEKRTIEEMGSALLVGGELDRVHRPKLQWKGMLLALALMLTGILIRTVFTPTGLAQPVSFVQCAGVCVAMGAILLLGLTDYMRWIWLAVPLTAAWSVLLALKLLDGPNAVSYYLHPRASLILLERVTIEHVALAAPLLTGLMIGKKRGGGRAAFVACMMVPVMTFLLGLSYTWRGYVPFIVMLMTLLCIVVLMLAVRKGFFQTRRAGVYAILGALTAAILVVLVFFPAHIDPAFHVRYWEEFVSPLLQQAGLWGSGRMDIELLVKMDELCSNDMMLPFIIYRYGWAAFAVLTAAAAGMLIWAGRKFVRMENRAGSLVGMTCTATLGLQIALYYIHSFTVFSWPLGLPLISYGTVVLWIDAAMIGIMLSVLRAEHLPETEMIGARKRSGGIAA